MFNEKQLKDIRTILKSEVERVLEAHTETLKKILHKIEHVDEEIEEIETKVSSIEVVNDRILTLLLTSDSDIEGFTDIIQGDVNMVPLAAGQTATFSTTPIPAGSVPDPTKLVWSSSDPVNAPVSPNGADPSGLSVIVTFPSTVVAGVPFDLTLTYTNSDGTVASQKNSFVTVAAPPSDVTGFNPIVQSA
jgi:hypothetical protein